MTTSERVVQRYILAIVKHTRSYRAMLHAVDGGGAIVEELTFDGGKLAALTWLREQRDKRSGQGVSFDVYLPWSGAPGNWYDDWPET